MRRTALTAALLAAATATPALAAGDTAPTFRTKEVWLSCANQQTKLYQANWAATLGDSSVYARWDDSRPTASFTTGAGCGGLDAGNTSNPVYDVPITGTFTGNISSITVTLHQLASHKLRTDATERLRLTGSIDGIPIFPPGVNVTAGRKVVVTPVASSTGASEALTFTITGLGRVLGDGTRQGVAYEDGDGVEEHTVDLSIGLDGGGDLTTKVAGAWAWDATEVPSGLVFNPATPAAAKVAADTPVYEQPAE